MVSKISQVYIDKETDLYYSIGLGKPNFSGKGSAQRKLLEGKPSESQKEEAPDEGS